jgi:HSP20 family protein
MDRLHRQMNELFESSFSRLWDDDGSLAGVRFDPSLDIEQDEHRYEISLELPGVSLEDVSVDVQGDQLVIEGSKTEGSGDKQRDKLQSKRRYGSFRQVLALPEDVDKDNISASFSSGVLTVSIPRDREKLSDRRRRIEVQGDESRSEKLVQGAPRKAESKGEKFAKGASQEADSADAAQQDKD